MDQFTLQLQPSSGVKKARQLKYKDIAISLVLGLSLLMISTLLPSILLGFAFATILFPMFQKKFVRKLPIRFRSAVFTLGFAILFLLPIGGLIFMGADATLDSIESFKAKYFAAEDPKNLEVLLDQITGTKTVATIRQFLPVDQTELRSVTKKLLSEGGSLISSLLSNVVKRIPFAILSTFIILFSLFFSLVDGPKLIQFLKSKSPFDPLHTNKIFSEAQGACYASIYASAVSGLIQAVLIGIGAFLTPLPYKWFLIMATLLCSFIPMVGTLPIALGGTLYLLIMGDSTAAIVFFIFSIVAGVSDNFTRPFFLSNASPIHPLAGLAFTIGGVAFMGFPGLFLGPVIARLFFSFCQLTPSYEERMQQSV